MANHRSDILLALLRGPFKGDRAELLKASKYSKGRISQMLKDGFGETSARNLEKRLELPERFFENQPGVHSAKLRSELKANPFKLLDDALDALLITGHPREDILKKARAAHEDAQALKAMLDQIRERR